MLEDQEKSRIDEIFQYTSHITPKQRQKLVELVGDKCYISLIIDGATATALWDTGSQVSLFSRRWLEEFVSDAKVDDLANLLNQKLDVFAAGGSKILYDMRV